MITKHMFTKFHRECDQFYIGLNTRILKKIKEHARRKYSNACKIEQICN